MAGQPIYYVNQPAQIEQQGCGWLVTITTGDRTFQFIATPNALLASGKDALRQVANAATADLLKFG